MDSRVARWVPSENRTRLLVVLLVLGARLATTGHALSRDDTGGPAAGTEPLPAAVAGPMATESGTTLERAPRVPREPEPAAPAGSPSQLVVPALGVDLVMQRVRLRPLLLARLPMTA